VPIVVGNKRIPPLARVKPGTGERGWAARKYRVGANGAQFIVYGKKIQAVEDNIAVIRAHFGCNRTDAFKMALHLTADAVRRGKLSL
jgi:hypothetical protein